MFIKSIVGYFVGESSKKRQMGLIAAFLFSFLYWQDVITLELFEAIEQLTHHLTTSLGEVVEVLAEINNTLIERNRNG